MTFAETEKPLINGLVLAGGKSQRMRRDKGKMQWHGKEQRYYAADLLKNFCEEVFISCRAEQQSEIAKEYQTLPDTFLDLGPYGGILSALRAWRERAWLVVACDLPLLDENTLRFLVEHRNCATIATTFISSHDNLPEPLITIWEPESYAVLLEFLGKGYSCPRKVLINSEVTLLQPPFPDAITNVNTPEDAAEIEKYLN